MTETSPANGDAGSASDEDDFMSSRFDALNRQFYQEHGPAEYILLRLNSLCLIGGAYEQFKSLLAKGIEFAQLGVSLDSVDETNEEIDESGSTLREHFVRIEAHHLKHLAIETLIRLFLGHKNLPVCPWWEMSKETQFWSFKERVMNEIVEANDSSLQSDVAHVFLVLPGGLSAADKEQLDVSHNLARFLRAFAADWLAEAKSYNATKHGLTAVPGSAEFEIGPTGEESIPLGYGDSLAHLTYGAWEQDRRTWSLTTRWIRLDQAVHSVAIVHHMLVSLWSIARARYCNTGTYYRSTLSSSQFSVENLKEIESCPMIEASMNMFLELQ